MKKYQFTTITMDILKKIFCFHKWETHSKESKEEEIYKKNNLGDYKPTGVIKQFTREVLICKNCGKIKTIEY